MSVGAGVCMHMTLLSEKVYGCFPVLQDGKLSMTRLSQAVPRLTMWGLAQHTLVKPGSLITVDKLACLMMFNFFLGRRSQRL